MRVALLLVVSLGCGANEPKSTSSVTGSTSAPSSATGRASGSATATASVTTPAAPTAPPYNGDNRVGPCKADADCKIFDSCGGCSPLLVGVNLGPMACKERRGSGCEGRKPGCDLAKQTCVVR
jgi:hypothetical protein